MCPAYLTDGGRKDKDSGLALKFFGAASAYPIETLSVELVVNDTIGPQEVVIVSDPRSKAARAYDRGGHTFTPTANPRQILDDNNEPVQLTETELYTLSHGSKALERPPSHRSPSRAGVSPAPRPHNPQGLPAARGPRSGAPELA